MPKRKPTTPALIRKLDSCFSRYVRLRDSDESGSCECVTCGKPLFWKAAHAGHFVSRRHMATRWDERNVNSQCCGCNTFNNGALDEYSRWILQKYGHEGFEDLLRLKRTTRKWLRGELEDLIAKYSAAARDLEARFASEF